MTMGARLLNRLCFIFIFPLLITPCATFPLGRKQMILVPDETMNKMGAQAFAQMKAQQPIEGSPRVRDYIACIVTPLTLSAQAGVPNWEVVVFRSEDANAFALPGGKIGVYTGLLKVAKTDAQLAAVIGHEIGHVVAHHGAERVSQQAGTQLGLSALGMVTKNNPNRDLLVGLLGVGAQFGILLPFSRTQESEADLIGLELMAKAGFDPQASVELWRNMIASAKGAAPPEWLSTHPASENRISNLQKHMPDAMTKFRQAQADQHFPSCDRSLLSGV